MKRIYLAFSAAVLFAACNNSPKTTDTTVQTSDTAGLAEYEAMKAQQAADSIELKNQSEAAALTASPASTPAAKSRTTTHKTSSSSGSSTASSSSGSGSSSGSSSSGSGSTATEKKGWSKTAKGAVIGGAVGAGTGAIINKNHRAKGAIIGGVIGAGAGAVIGRDMDKKDGRH